MTMEPGQRSDTSRSDVDLVRSMALSSAELWHEILERLREVQESQVRLAGAIETLGTMVRDALAPEAQPVLGAHSPRAGLAPGTATGSGADRPASILPGRPSEPRAAAGEDPVAPSAADTPASSTGAPEPPLLGGRPPGPSSLPPIASLGARPAYEGVPNFSGSRSPSWTRYSGSRLRPLLPTV